MKNKLKYAIGALFSAGLVLAGGYAYSQDSPRNPPPKTEIKEGAKEVGHGTTKVAKGVAHGTKKAAKTVGHKTKKAAKDVKNDVKSKDKED